MGFSAHGPGMTKLRLWRFLSWRCSVVSTLFLNHLLRICLVRAMSFGSFSATMGDVDLEHIGNHVADPIG